MGSGERPIGAAKGNQSDTEALCQPPPPPLAPNHDPQDDWWVVGRCPDPAPVHQRVVSVRGLTLH